MQIRSVQWQDGRFGPDIGTPEASASLDDLRTAIPNCNYMGLDARIRCADGSNECTPEEEVLGELDAAISEIHAHGLKVILRVKLRGATSLLFVPPDIPTYLANYASSIAYWADYAQSRHVEVLGIGCEMSPEMEAADWSGVIAVARSYFKGRLYYNTNWWWNTVLRDVKLNATWMRLLDILAISAYPDKLISATNLHPTSDELEYGWRNAYVSNLGESLPESFHRFSAQHGGKPLLYHIGLASGAGAASQPWAYVSDAAVDLDVQANWFDAFFRVLGSDHGVFLDGGWQTWPDKNPNNNEFIVQNKPAESVVQYYFSILTPSSQLGNLLIPLGFVGGVLWLRGGKSKLRG